MNVLTKNKTILILERDFNLASGLKTILEREGYNVLADFSLLDPDERGDFSKVDLIIININMPKKFGLSILRKVNDTLPGVPLIAMSVYAHSFSKNEISRLGVDDFVSKPFEIEYLKGRIEALISRKT